MLAALFSFSSQVFFLAFFERVGRSQKNLRKIKRAQNVLYSSTLKAQGVAWRSVFAQSGPIIYIVSLGFNGNSALKRNKQMEGLFRSCRQAGRGEWMKKQIGSFSNRLAFMNADGLMSSEQSNGDIV
jgi:hypothetical protein